MNDPYPRSFWLDEAPALGQTDPSPALTADTRANVCIVGGGPYGALDRQRSRMPIRGGHVCQLTST